MLQLVRFGGLGSDFPFHQVPRYLRYTFVIQYNAGLFVSSAHLSHWTRSIPNCLKPYKDSIEWPSAI